METNLLRQATLNEEVGCSHDSDGCVIACDIIRTINAIAIQLEASIIENKINAPASLVTEILDGVPKLMEVVPKDVFLGCSEVIAASGLKGFDLFLGHINE